MQNDCLPLSQQADQREELIISNSTFHTEEQC